MLFKDMLFKDKPYRGLLSALALAVTAAGFSAVSLAADRVELSLNQLAGNSKGQVSLAKAQVSGEHNSFKSLLGSKDAFKMASDRNTIAGEALERGQQTYKGIPVWGAEFAATRSKEGKYTFAVGSLLQNIDRDIPNLKTTLNARQATAVAMKLKRVGRRPVKGKNAGVMHLESQKAAQLVVFQRDDGVATLAWKTEFSIAAKPGKLPSQPVQVIDANSGKLLLEYDMVHTVEARGTGLGGNQRMGQINHGATENGVDGALTVDKNGLTCTLKNAKVTVADAGRSASKTASPKTFTCSTADNKFSEATVNGGYGVLNDILYNGTKTVQMYQDWFGVFPLTCGSVVKQWGHYDNALDNAFWQNCSMAYGDGNTFHPLVSMDVVAHEIAHGVTEGRSGLQYSGQSGGLNESFSDMSGTALVYYLTGANSWKIGDQIKKTSGQMRCMDDPTCDGRSIKHVSNYTSSMDVHHSSGVYNHAFYRLGTSSGWTTKKAFEVYYRANDQYWTSSSTFAQAGEGVCKAANDLGYDGNVVKASLQAVGVNPTSCGSTPPPPPPGDTVLSNGTATGNLSFTKDESKYFVLDVPAGATGLSFSTSGGSGDVDLYVKFGSRASKTVNDCKGEGSTNAETCAISTAQAGKYYVTVLGYAASSGVSVKGQYTGTTPPPPPPSGELTNGVPVSNLSFTLQESKRYTLVVPVGATGLTFTTSGGSGDVDLYVKFGSAPSTTVSDCKGESSTTAETCTISNIQAGTYHVLVYGYAASSGVSVKGQYTTMPGGGNVLTNGVPVNNLSFTAQESKRYTMTVPAGATNLMFASSGGSGDTDLYVKFGSEPSTTVSDCKSEGQTTAETCSIPSVQAGTYHVLVYGYSAASGVSLTGSYSGGSISK